MTGGQARARMWLGGMLAAIAALVIVAEAAAQAGSTRSLTRKIQQLERKIQDLERQVYRGDPPAPQAGGGQDTANRATGAELRITSIEQQLRAITGRLEESEHRVRQLETRHERLVGTLDGRLRELERRLAEFGAGALAAAPTSATASDGSVIVSGGGTPGGGTPAAAAHPQENTTSTASARPAPVAPTGVVLPEGTPRQQYRYAQGLLRTSRFEAAEQAFRAFMAAHPVHELTPLSNYWLGDTLYLRKAYQEAARVYFDGYQRFPDSSKANDTLLKLGLSLARLGQTDEACGIYSELLGRLKKSERRLRPRTVREMRVNKCG